MRPKVYLPLAFLFLAIAVPSQAQNAAEEKRVAVGEPLTVECALRVEQRAEWSKDGAPPPPDMIHFEESASGGRLTARLHASHARPAHAGLYSCGGEPAQRVRVRVLSRQDQEHTDPAPGDPPAAETTVATPSSNVLPHTLQYYDVGRSFVLNCSDVNNPTTTSYIWKANGTALEKLPGYNKDKYTFEENNAVLRVGAKPGTRSTEEDFGNYTCGLRDVVEEVKGWEVRGRPQAKMNENWNAVEGQKLKMTCRIIGKPYPAVDWLYRNDSEVNGTDAVTALGARASVRASEQGVEGAELVVDPAERSDAGFYECVPRAAEGVRAHTTLRVKDKYAALWPFLGICAEVFILCAVILVYEKRRTKPELDDSDTDNHDQKKS